jgi:hypothetical protein
MTRRHRWSISAGAVTLGLALTAYFAIAKAIDHFLNNGPLDRLISRKTAVILKADAGYLPFFWRGLSVHSDGLLVRGKPPRSLTELRASKLQAYCSFQSLWQRKWRVQRLQASHLEAAFGAAAAEQLQKLLPNEPELQPQIETASPLNLEIRETVVPHTDLFWGKKNETVGYLHDVVSKYYPRDHELDVFASGGTFRQTGWPEMNVGKVELHYAKPKLEVRSASLGLGRPENIAVKGSFDFGAGGGMRLHTVSSKVPVEPFLTGFWRDKFDGIFEGESEIEKKFSPDAHVTAAGKLRFKRAELYDVETLKKIAAVTHHQEFEHLHLQELSGQYQWTGAKLEVTDFRMEQKGLFRVEGTFSLENKNIVGNFQIGASENVLGAIPGAREKVFTELRDGYLWTSMRVSGPMNHPREDLKERLVVAALEQLAKGFLAPILKPGKTLIEAIDALYK